MVIGAGIAGAAAAANLAPDRRVALIEAEESAGYHTTGRSAATWFLNYGPPDVRAMTGASGAFFHNPPPGFTAAPLKIRRGVHARAGLRSFLPDGSFALGWDVSAEGFFWCIGQGGYGIQTSPAAGRLVADLVAGRDPGELGRILARIDPRRFVVAIA